MLPHTLKEGDANTNEDTLAAVKDAVPVDKLTRWKTI